MSRYLLDADTDTHVRQYVHRHAHEPNRIVLETESDVEPARAEARFYRDLAAVTPLKNRQGRMMAVVPIDLFVKAQRQRWGQKEWRKWLRDPDNRDLCVERAEGMQKGWK